MADERFCSVIKSIPAVPLQRRLPPPIRFRSPIEIIGTFSPPAAALPNRIVMR
jgi:hypothetical protein